MTYTFFLYSSPFHSPVPWEAYALARVLLARQHHINAAFFYADAVWIADKNNKVIQNKTQHKYAVQYHHDIPDNPTIGNIGKAWSDLALSVQLPCYICISSAMKRGIASDDLTDNSRLWTGFHLSSLTEFIALKNQSEKVLSF